MEVGDLVSHNYFNGVFLIVGITEFGVQLAGFQHFEVFSECHLEVISASR